ncbi:MAG: hypothetical protein QMD04_07970 [Anaerolineales bacterium]|nr:hypothetical protein [Anaerolineales bacterium]
MFSNAFSLVEPWLTQPGIDGHSAEGLLGNPDAVFIAAIRPTPLPRSALPA